MLSEESRLRHFDLKALASLVVILLVELKADEVSLLFNTSNGGCAAAHTVVEHRVALVGVGENELAQQVNGLLGGVKMPCARWITIIKHALVVTSFLLYVIRIALNYGYMLSFMLTTTLYMTRFQFGVVIRWHLTIEYADYLMEFQRLNLAYLKIACFCLYPYPIISPFFQIAHPQHRTEWLRTEQHDCRIWLAYSSVLLPQLVERYHAIPSAGGCPIRQIANHRVNRSVGNLLHPLQAVHVVDVVYLHKILQFSNS